MVENQGHRIFGLLQLIKNEEERQRVLDLANRIGADTVEGLAAHSPTYLLIASRLPPSIAGQPSMQRTLRELERLMQDNYGTSFARARQIRTEKYVIIDQGRTVVVNGVLIDPSTIPDALPKPQVIQVYELNGNGKTAEEVLEEMRRVNPSITLPVVQTYLKMANLIPQQQPQPAMLEQTVEQTEATKAAAQQPALVSGAPPPSLHSASAEHYFLKALMRRN